MEKSISLDSCIIYCIICQKQTYVLDLIHRKGFTPYIGAVVYDEYSRLMQRRYQTSKLTNLQAIEKVGIQILRSDTQNIQKIYRKERCTADALDYVYLKSNPTDNLIASETVFHRIPILLTENKRHFVYWEKFLSIYTIQEFRNAS